MNDNRRFGSYILRTIKRCCLVASLYGLSIAAPAKAGIFDLVRSFPSPMPDPRLELDFDTNTSTLWGVSNANFGPIGEFDLNGNLLTSWPAGFNHNANGVAVNQATGVDRRIYYWGNLQQTLFETTTAGQQVSATFAGTVSPTTFTSVTTIARDPLTGLIMFAYAGSSIRPAGLYFIEPGVGITQEIPFDYEDVTDLDDVLGLTITDTDFWLLGPTSPFTDAIVRIDRTSLYLIDVVPMPDVDVWQSYRGLTRDPATGYFYTNYKDGSVRVFSYTRGTIPEPSCLLMVLSAIVAIPAHRHHRKNP